MNRIHCKGDYGRQDEAVAGAAGIYPGMLLKRNSAGEVVVHDVEGGRGEKAFAMEDVLNEGGTVETVYDDEAIVTYLLPKQGEEVYALIQAGQDVTDGDPLISAGDGTLKVADDIISTGEVLEIIAYAMEDCDATGSNLENTLAKVRVN